MIGQLVMLFSLLSYSASTKDSFSFVFKVEGHQTPELVKSFEYKQNGFWLNGYPLAAERVIAFPEKISVLKSIKLQNTKELKCKSGKFTFYSNYKRKKNQGSGCIGSNQFKQLSSAFKALSN